MGGEQHLDRELAGCGGSRRSRRTAANNYAQPTGVVLSLKCITPPRIVGFELGYRFTN